MMQSAICQSYRSHIKKVHTRIIISWIIFVLLGIYLFSMFMRPFEELQIGAVLVSAVLFEFAMIAIMFLSAHRVRTKKYAGIAGKNLCFGVSADGIDIEDNADGIIIKKEFKWDDFVYIHKVCYTKTPTAIKKIYGLQFVINEKEFHQSLSQRKRKPDYSQRDEELNHGFFIICDTEYFDEVARLWGRKIR